MCLTIHFHPPKQKMKRSEPSTQLPIQNARKRSYDQYLYYGGWDPHLSSPGQFESKRVLPFSQNHRF